MTKFSSIDLQNAFAILTREANQLTNQSRLPKKKRVKKWVIAYKSNKGHILVEDNEGLGQMLTWSRSVVSPGIEVMPEDEWFAEPA